MSKEIYKLYKEYNNKPLDNNFINKAFELMLDQEKELIPYINDFRITGEYARYLGAYLPEDRIIKINKELIEKQNINHQLFTLHIIKHELEHARNLKTLYEGKNDIESLIIYYSLRSYAIEHNLERFPNLDHLYKDFLEIETKMNYKTNPGERLTDIKACKYIVNLLKNQRNSEDLLISRIMLYYAYTRGYKDNRYYIDPPTYEFLLKTGQFHDHYLLKNRINKNDYSFNTRITYGLPITNEEYNKQVLHKVKLYKKNWIIKERSPYE